LDKPDANSLHGYDVLISYFLNRGIRWMVMSHRVRYLHICHYGWVTVWRNCTRGSADENQFWWNL